MRFRKIVRMFERGSVCVFGVRGAGKDLLMSNVIARRALPYVSNVPYGGEQFPLDFDLIDCGRNTYTDFLAGEVNAYDFPYPDGTDIYLSDAGVYLPSQYCGEINKRYPYIATFQALSRHLGQSNFHFNAQSLNRVYDKVREQSEQYILCNWCRVIFGFVIQRVTIYDKYDSAVAKVKPCRIRKPLICLSAERRERIAMYLDDFYNKHGSVRSALLIYRHKGTYDTRYFKTFLGGKTDET